MRKVRSALTTGTAVMAREMTIVAGVKTDTRGRPNTHMLKARQDCTAQHQTECVRVSAMAQSKVCV